MARSGKRLRAAREGLDRTRPLKLQDALTHLKKHGGTKFDQTVEIAVNLNLDARQSDQQVRGTVMLPAGTGKTIRVAVFARDQAAEAARAAGADLVGAEDLAETVQKGEIEFDRAVATPDCMPVVGRLGKILGPRGLMPNPKLGTVTTDVATAVQAAKGGQVAFRAEKAGVVHAGIGKTSFDEGSLAANVQAFVGAIRDARPAGAKGVYIEKIWLSSTMGPGVQLDVADLEAEAQATA